MVLAGQKPEVIMEICSRALAFWTYQVRHEFVLCMQLQVSGELAVLNLLPNVWLSLF